MLIEGNKTGRAMYKDILEDGDVLIEHLPKFWPSAGGMAYYLREIIYGMKLL